MTFFLSPLAAYLFAALLVFGGWHCFRVISSGVTAVRTERSLHRHSTALKGITKER